MDFFKLKRDYQADPENEELRQQFYNQSIRNELILKPLFDFINTEKLLYAAWNKNCVEFVILGYDLEIDYFNEVERERYGRINSGRGYKFTHYIMNDSEKAGEWKIIKEEKSYSITRVVEDHAFGRPFLTPISFRDIIEVRIEKDIVLFDKIDEIQAKIITREKLSLKNS